MIELASKTQWIRLLDIPLGIFMIWFGKKASKVPKWSKNLMIISGILTILYNGRNFLINEGII